MTFFIKQNGDIVDINKPAIFSEWEIAICGYGDYLHIIQRSINSILLKSTYKRKIHVCLNSPSQSVITWCTNHLIDKNIDSLFISHDNVNKDPMMRKCIDHITSKYMLWFDDDSYVDNDGWDVKLDELLKNNPCDVAGFIHSANRYGFGTYQSFVEKKSWWKKFPFEHDKNKCVFPIGSCWVGNLEYLRKWDYPDRSMVKKCDDMLLGDLIHSTGGKMISLFGWDIDFKVNTEKRRGFGESDTDGFK